MKTTEIRQFAIGLTNLLESCDLGAARDFILEFFENSSSKGNYPCGIGFAIFNSLASFPQKNINKMEFPLIPRALMRRIFSKAREKDYADAWLFYLSCTGESIRSLTYNDNSHGAPYKSQLNQLTEKINHSQIIQKICLPIDSACASYPMESVTVEPDKFGKKLESFYTHLLSAIRTNIVPSDSYAIEADAFSLLVRAFQNKGGLKAVYTEILDGSHGGLRFIFNTMCDQLKAEETESYINFILKTELELLDWIPAWAL